MANFDALTKWDALNYIDCYHSMKSEKDFEFYRTDNEEDNPLYIGFELESSASHDDADRAQFALEALKATSGYLRMEDDCSLEGHCIEGIEFISMPCTLNYHLADEQLNSIRELGRAASNNGFTSHNNGRCGLHMHINRSYFYECGEESAITKLLYIFRNHWANMLKFSRRKDSQVEQWAGPYFSEYSCEYIAQNQWEFERYHFLNLTNEDTLEIRLWRGTFRMETFEATLRFTARLAKIARDVPITEVKNMTWEEVLGDDPVINSYWQTVKDRSI